MKTTITLARRTLLPLLALVLLFSNLSCYCWSAGHATTKTCADIKSMVDCMKPEVQKDVQALLPTIAILLATENPGPAIALLESFSWAGVTCAINIVGQDASNQLMSLPTPSAPAASEAIIQKRLTLGRTIANYQAWKVDHPETVKTK